jgi:hypothetical protein
MSGHWRLAKQQRTRLNLCQTRINDASTTTTTSKKHRYRVFYTSLITFRRCVIGAAVADHGGLL